MQLQLGLMVSALTLTVTATAFADHKTPPTGFTPSLGSLAPIAEPAQRSVVKVINKVKITKKMRDRENYARKQCGLRPNFDPIPKEPQENGSGSGAIFSKDGYILTNNHVVEGGDLFDVITLDHQTLPATLVGADPQTDLAVLKVDSKYASDYFDFANSSDVHVGDQVLAIGYPLFMDSTVTSGIVSHKGWVEVGGSFDLVDFIQISAAINPGNSGGALVNMAGELLGINAQIISKTGNFAGIGLSIPSNLAKAIAQELVQTGKVTRGRVGLNSNPVTSEDSKINAAADKYLGFPIITGVAPQSPAQKGGLQTGDIVVKLNGTLMDKHYKLLRVVTATKPGTTLKAEVIGTNGKSRTVTITAEARKPEAPKNENQPPELSPEICRALAQSDAAASGEMGE